jgi:hypothetical protein
MSELEKESQGDSFQKFASQALRLQRKGSFEQLLAQHLIQSVSMDPLNKVRLVLEAAFIVPRDKLEIDWELAEAIYLATLGFLNTNIQGEFIAMAWGFRLTEDSFKRFIKPWHKDLPLAFAAGCDAEIEREQKNSEDKG